MRVTLKAVDLSTTFAAVTVPSAAEAQVLVSDTISFVDGSATLVILASIDGLPTNNTNPIIRLRRGSGLAGFQLYNQVGISSVLAATQTGFGATWVDQVQSTSAVQYTLSVVNFQGTVQYATLLILTF